MINRGLCPGKDGLPLGLQSFPQISPEVRYDGVSAVLDLPGVGAGIVGLVEYRLEVQCHLGVAGE